MTTPAPHPAPDPTSYPTSGPAAYSAPPSGPYAAPPPGPYAAPPPQHRLVPPSTGGLLTLRTVLVALLIAGMVQTLLTRDEWWFGFGNRPEITEPGMRVEIWGIAVLVCLGLLIFGPQPRWATKWAWFWVTLAVGPLWLVFVLFEPVPIWIKQPLPAAKRFTGGWSFLLSLFVLGPLAAALLPGLADVL